MFCLKKRKEKIENPDMFSLFSIFINLSSFGWFCQFFNSLGRFWMLRISIFFFGTIWFFKASLSGSFVFFNYISSGSVHNTHLHLKQTNNQSNRSTCISTVNPIHNLMNQNCFVCVKESRGWKQIKDTHTKNEEQQVIPKASDLSPDHFHVQLPNWLQPQDWHYLKWEKLKLVN